MLNQILVSRLQAALVSHFGLAEPSPRLFFAPARVNLIGEHIDYCGGLVLPATLQFGTWLLARPNGKGLIRALSLNQDGRVEFDPNSGLVPGQGPAWGDYLKGVCREYRRLGLELPGLDLAVVGDIPGNGLSSSASLEVAMAVTLQAFSGYRFDEDPQADRRALSWLTQRAENQFVGVNCGIMDQGAIALGRADRGMLMNCRDLEVDYVPIELGDASLLVVNSNKARTLADSAYNQRRNEVERALEILRPRFGILDLCELDAVALPEALALLPNEILRSRVRHVVTEQQRVLAAADTLVVGDIAGFGRLLTASHRSLQQDYEVTGAELDALVGAALEQPGVLGARMTGAGFGGCCLLLLEQTAVPAVIEQVATLYRDATGLEAEFYPVQIGPGAGEIDQYRSLNHAV